MSISTNVDVALKEAMFKKDDPLKATLRNIKSKLLEAVKNNQNQSLSDETEIKVLEKMIRDREKSIEMCSGKGANGDTIAANEKREIGVIKTFLPEKPEQMTVDQINAAVSEIKASNGYTTMKDMGKLMSDFGSKYPGQDKKLVSECIKTQLM